MGLFATLPLPNPPVAQAGHPPQWGQRTSLDGQPCIIRYIGEKVDEGYIVFAEVVGHPETAGHEASHTPRKDVMGVFSLKTGTIGRREEENGSLVAIPGQQAKRGQWAVYVNDDGTKLPCIIVIAGDVSPDGKFQNVAAIKMEQPRLMADGTIKPSGTTFGGWIYDIEDGTVLYDPCAPPWPADDASSDNDGDDV